MSKFSEQMSIPVPPLLFYASRMLILILAVGVVVGGLLTDGLTRPMMVGMGIAAMFTVYREVRDARARLRSQRN